jgi:excisionase family DNA binding protein
MGLPEPDGAPVADVISSATSKLAYSVPEFCEATSLGRSLVYEEIRKGRLRATKIGTRTIILREDGLAWLRSHG